MYSFIVGLYRQKYAIIIERLFSQFLFQFPFVSGQRLDRLTQNETNPDSYRIGVNLRITYFYIIKIKYILLEFILP